jgi:predicted O-methyltransferase YrrM
LLQILSRHAGGTFAEVGIGPHPNLGRHAVMAEKGIRYTGIDFSAVCESHARALAESEMNRPDIELVGNARGTYSWNLAKLAATDQKFDTIYFDGNHTFYVDLPAAILSSLMVRSGGTLIFDDYHWTMALLARNIYESFTLWKFYRKMYDFSLYEADQISVPHNGSC